MDNRYRKYHEARVWLKAPRCLPALEHDFAKFFAESDWDDPAAAWNQFRDNINSGKRW